MWESSVLQMFSYTVGLPPSIVLNEPVIGSLYNEGESILFVAEVSDSEDAPGDL